VYLYEGFNVSPDDEGGAGPVPKMSAMVNFDKAISRFAYSFGYVPFGKYTAVFTCEADIDDPDVDDVINFSTTRNVNITSVGVTSLGNNTFRFNGNNGNNGNGNNDD